jgi:pimeloyl-ACP methyl ester carboxylesterase
MALMIRESHAELSGRRVRYLEAGAGWPLVLIHAFPLAADMWRPQLERVPDGWRFLAPDTRGFGPGAVASATPPSIDDLAGDVVALLDQLELERATIAGLSMGGYVALALFRVAPERVTGLVLANTRAGADSADGRAGRDKLIALAREGGPQAVADQMLPKLLGDTTRRARPDLPRAVRAMIEGNSAEAIAGALHAMKERPDSTALLPRINLPALVVAGEEDALIPVAESEAMDRALPRSHLVVLPASGHLSSFETPDDFSEALGNFLRANL